MASSAPVPTEFKRTPKRAAAAALVGTSIEWYDFFIYATAAALVFREVFFDPNLPPVVGFVVAFGTTSFGYLGRPVGALIFGSLGDKIGRKRTLVVTLLLMGTATFCMGLLPTYASVGALAPILLVTLRFLQGVAVGGEWGGAAMLSVEHAPEGRRTFMGSFTQMGSSVGALFSSVVFLIAERMGGLLEGWWRLPFLFSAVLVIVALIVRSTVEESPEFRLAKTTGQISLNPVKDVFTKHRKLVLLGAGIMLVATGGYYVTSSFFLAYGTDQAGLDTELLLNALTIGAIAEVIFMPFAGWLGDRFSPQLVATIGLLGIAVVAYPLFLSTQSGSPALIIAMCVVVAACTAFNYGPMPHILYRLFPIQVRYTGVSMSYQAAALTSGVLTPIIVPLLLAAGGGNPGLVVVYTAILCLAAVACVRLSRRVPEPRELVPAP